MAESLYLCGPMTGIAHLNYPAFREEAHHLRSRGYLVYSPAELGLGPEVPWEVCLKRAIALLVRADAVATLPGVRQSAGARLECSLAVQLGMPVMPVAEWGWLTPRPMG